MFKKRNVQQQNTAAIPAGIPRPAQTVINNQASEAAVILAKGFLAIILAPIAWYFLLYVVEEMGYRNPVKVVGWSVFGFALLGAATSAVYFGGTHFFLLWRDYQLQIKEIEAETARSLAMTAAQPRSGESRLTEEDSKFAALLRVVMDEAYRHIYRDRDVVQQYSHNEQKPWSRRANTGRSIPGIEGTVTEQMASRVAAWLMEQGVIDKKGVIDISDRGYPSFAHFERLLEEKFYTPIQVQKALSPTLRREVSFIENS